MRGEKDMSGGSFGGLSTYLFGEPMPVPEVIEEDSDACWALWEELNREQSVRPEVQRSAGPELLESQWMGTTPDAIPAASQPGDPSAPLTVETLLAIARQNNRVCPQPAQWMLLYDVLTLGGKRVLKPYPPAPVSGRAWFGTSAMGKRVRMRDQIVWAADYGGLSAIHAFLSSLSEDDWYHVGQ